MRAFKTKIVTSLDRWSEQLRHVPAWSSMKRFGQSRLLRSSYLWLFLVPVAARALSKVSGELHVPFFGNNLTLLLQLPFSWQIWFYASCAFSIASFVFSVYCPQLIRDYDRYDQFRDEGKGFSQILDALFRTLGNMSRHDDSEFGLRFLAEFPHQTNSTCSRRFSSS